MRNKMLNGMVIVFALILGFILFVDERSISHFMDACGNFIAGVLGF